MTSIFACHTLYLGTRMFGLHFNSQNTHSHFRNSQLAFYLPFSVHQNAWQLLKIHCCFLPHCHICVVIRPIAPYHLWTCWAVSSSTLWCPYETCSCVVAYIGLATAVRFGLLGGHKCIEIKSGISLHSSLSVTWMWCADEHSCWIFGNPLNSGPKLREQHYHRK